MPWFDYKARNSYGEVINGRLEAVNEQNVAKYLIAQKIIPLEILRTQTQVKKFNWRFPHKITLKDLAFFCRQLHTLLKAGVPIFEAFFSLRQSNNNTPLGEVLAKLIVHLEAGMELSEAFKRQNKIFSPLFISLVKIGEHTGSLDAAFLQLSIYLEKEQNMRANIVAALRYPIIIFIAIAIALVVVNIFVIPSFAKFFEKNHATLPLLTRLLFGFSDVMIHYWYLLLGIVGGTIVWIKKILEQPAGKLQWDKLKLKLPIIGSILINAALSRFARALAINMKSGMPWSHAMALIGQSMANTHLEKIVSRMGQHIERGESMAKAARDAHIFPPLVIQMIHVGEQSGSLDELMEEVAQYYDREVDYALKSMSAAIEPILTLVIGAFILVLALGIFLPMWGIAGAALKK